MDDGGNNLVRIDTQKNAVIANVNVPDAIEILLWDYKSAVLYAWIATETDAGVLATIDIDSGNRTSTIVSFENYSANGGSAVIDVNQKMVYASLVDMTTGADTAVWVTVDLKTGKATVALKDEDYGNPVDIALTNSF